MHMPKVSSENSEALKRAPRRLVAKPKTAGAVAEVASTTQRRKSPTSLPTSSVTLVKRRKITVKRYVALGVMVTGLALAAFIGYSDKGQINITSVMTERNAKLTAGLADSEGGSGVIVPVQNTSNLPNGGLIGSTEPPTVTPLPVIETATTTSTSTASTTEEVVTPEVITENTTTDESVTSTGVEAAQQ